MLVSATLSMLEFFCYVWQAAGGDPPGTELTDDDAIDNLTGLLLYGLRGRPPAPDHQRSRDHRQFPESYPQATGSVTAARSESRTPGANGRPHGIAASKTGTRSTRSPIAWKDAAIAIGSCQPRTLG